MTERKLLTLWVVYDYKGEGVADFDRENAMDRYDDNVGNVAREDCFIKAVRLNAPLPQEIDEQERTAPTVDLPDDPQVQTQ